jgi:mannosyl-3-phosphoglycerate phosphatase
LWSIEYVQSRRIPIVFCSAKTRAEQEVYRRELGISDPFIVENGGAVFVPQGYFPFRFDYQKETEGYQVTELGMPYAEIRQIITQVRQDTGIDLVGFGDMSITEVAAETGLDVDAARRAKQREYDETIKMNRDPAEMQKVLDVLQKAGLNCAHGGALYDVMGPNDKGKAAEIIIGLYRQHLGAIEVVGIGDSQNDGPMLAAVDIPVLVQQPDRTWQELDIPYLYRVEGAGPAGWARAIDEIIRTADSMHL